jgi:hypothetical protein
MLNRAFFVPDGLESKYSAAMKVPVALLAW